MTMDYFITRDNQAALMPTTSAVSEDDTPVIDLLSQEEVKTEVIEIS